jgi:hypothetical protein
LVINYFTEGTTEEENMREKIKNGETTEFKALEDIKQRLLIVGEENTDHSNPLEELDESPKKT